jgi:hypothetical protein
MNIKRIQSAIEFFKNLHDIEVNQKYNDNLPYSFHLEMVSKQAKLFEHLISNLSKEDWEAVWIGIWGHDSIEDARLSYNDVVNKFGKREGDIIYLCTEHRGRDREERKPKIFYEELSNDNLATFVKLCDIIANTKFSILTNSRMLVKYKSEYYEKVRPILWKPEFDEMFLLLDKLYEI